MSNTKTRAPRFITETGIAIWPKLVEPDEFKGTKAYKTELRLPADSKVFDAKGKCLGSLQQFLDEKNAEAFEAKAEEYKGKKDKKGKPIVITEGDAPYRLDEDNGDLIPKFKLNAEGTTRDGKAFTQKPALFDAKGKPVTPEAIWGGSRIKISFEVIPYCVDSARTAGISLRLKAVQIIELRAGGQGGDASGYGFGEEEGYEGEDAAGDAGFGEEDGYEGGDNGGDDNGGDF